MARCCTGVQNADLAPELAMRSDVRSGHSLRDRDIVLVAAMHRSGSSALTRGLQALGVELGDRLVPAMPFNPRGLFENEEINHLSGDVLDHFGVDWDTMAALEQSDFDSLRGLSVFSRATDLLRELVGGAGLFGFKNPRSCILLPFWKLVFRELGLRPRVILCLRNPLDVAHSLARRNGFPRDKSLLLWLFHTSSVLEHVARDECLVVHYDCLLDAPARELARMADFLRLDTAARRREIDLYCRDFIDDDLRHARSTPQDLQEASSEIPQLADAYQSLVRMADCDPIPDPLWQEARRFLVPVLHLWRSFGRVDLRDQAFFGRSGSKGPRPMARLLLCDEDGREETISIDTPASGPLLFATETGGSRTCQLRLYPFDGPCAVTLVRAVASFPDGRRQQLRPESSNAVNPSGETWVFTQEPVILFAVSGRPRTVTFELYFHARSQEVPVYYGHRILNDLERQRCESIPRMALDRLKTGTAKRFPAVGRLLDRRRQVE